MSNGLFMGIDIGTSGVRAALFDIEGNQTGLCHMEYPLICMKQGMAELDPELVFKSFIKVVKGCIDQTGVEKNKISAVGISTMNMCGEKSIYSLFDRYASETPPGSDGLIFLPFLTGERSPNWNANITGTLHGLRLVHGRKHFIRAAMEGVMFRMFSVYEVLSQLNNNVQQIKANGGYVNSDVWLQMQADIFNREIAVAGVGEAATLGAAYTAMAAVGAIKSLKQKLPVMEPLKVIKPMPENAGMYKKVYSCFKELYSKIN